MNAFNNVNLAAACLMTSAQYARELGIPGSKWVYPLGGAGTQDADNCMVLVCGLSSGFFIAYMVHSQSGSARISIQALRFRALSMQLYKLPL